MTTQRPYLVCVTADQPHAFADDVDATCAQCGAAIYHRPHALLDQPTAIPICKACFLRQLPEKVLSGTKVNIFTTPRMAREAAAELRRRRHIKEGREHHINHPNTHEKKT